MMKSVFAGIIALLIIGTGAYPQEMTGAHATLMQFASFAADKQLEVNDWTITMKEKITRNEAESIKQKLQKYFEEPVVINESTMNAEKYTISDSQKNEDIVETYSMIFPENKQSNVEMVYTVEGEGKPSLRNLKQNEIKEETRRFFSKNVTIFTCVKATYDGIIDDVLVYEKFEAAFNVITIDVIDENGWTSRTGYTKEWDQSIPTKGRLMNSQFATRTLGGKTNITIGTPIITAEY